MLEIKDLSAYYGAVRGLDGVSMTVKEKSCVAVLGANGSGKSTLLRALSGLIDRVEGDILFNGDSLIRPAWAGFSRQSKVIKAHRIVSLGISHVPEGAQVFSRLTVAENLLMGAYLRKDTRNFDADINLVLDFFPVLKQKYKQIAGNLSGGEQQMLAIGRALLSKPKLLMLDEPSTGLAPRIVKEVFRILARIRDEQGCSFLIVEQNVNAVLEFADFAYVLKLGRIADAAPARKIVDQVQETYLGD